MLLLIDAGNSSTKVGFYDKGNVREVLRLKTIREGRGAEEYSCILSGLCCTHQIRTPRGAVLCSVVPEATPALLRAIKKTFSLETLRVDHRLKTGLKYLVQDPEEIGADRIANAAAAYYLYDKKDLIVVDFGTATTFCMVSEKGEYRGGAIMPGLLLSAHVLAEKTAKLPFVDLKAPGSIPGKTTEENIRAGIILGHAGAVERIVSEIQGIAGRKHLVIATGGLCGLIKPYIQSVDHVNPLLTLEGLRLMYEMNPL